MLDFGLAKATREGSVDGNLTHEGQMLGTPDYIAPEQSLNAQKADIRADIYSLGCTLYYLLSGGPPFRRSSLYEILQAHHSVEATHLNLVRPDVPWELAAVVAKMMAKEPRPSLSNSRRGRSCAQAILQGRRSVAPGTQARGIAAKPAGRGRPNDPAVVVAGTPASESVAGVSRATRKKAAAVDASRADRAEPTRDRGRGSVGPGCRVGHSGIRPIAATLVGAGDRRRRSC